MIQKGNTLQDILRRDNEHIFKNMKDSLSKIYGSTVLITGSKGFLGKTVLSFLNYLNEEKLSAADKVNIIALDYDDFDICSPLDRFVVEENIDYIINFAGIASPKKYLQKPIETLDVSYLGTKNIFELARKRNTKSILMFS